MQRRGRRRQGAVHREILAAVRSIQRPRTRQQHQQQRTSQHQHPRDVLGVQRAYGVNRQSVEYLVDFLRGDSHEVTCLDLWFFSLLEPSDGGLDVLRDFLANGGTTLTKVILRGCNFGSAQEASRLFAAFNTDQSCVTDLDIRAIQGAAPRSFLFDALEENARLQRLTILLRNEDLGLLVGALVGNTTLEELKIRGDTRFNHTVLVTAITRLAEFTQLRIINREGWNNHHYGTVNDVTMRRLMHALHQNTCLEELNGLRLYNPDDPNRAMYMDKILVRNGMIRRAKALLQLQPRTPRLPLASKSGIWSLAMAQLAAPDHSGASAIFHILQSRPALLERQLLRPQQQQQQPQPPRREAASSGQQQVDSEQERPLLDDDDGNNTSNEMASASATVECGRKRARLS